VQYVLLLFDQGTDLFGRKFLVLLSYMLTYVSVELNLRYWRLHKGNPQRLAPIGIET